MSTKERSPNTVEVGGWTWERSIGLYYGTGPKGQRADVAQPLMTSPWWVIGTRKMEDFVPIYSSAKEAMLAVAERQPQPGETLSTKYQPESRMKWDWGWDKWTAASLPDFDDPDEAEEWVRDKERRVRERYGPRQDAVEYRIVKVRRVVEREVKV